MLLKTTTTAILLLAFTYAPAVALQIDLNNVVAGDVLTTFSPIPDGATINLNGGSIADGTIFSNTQFPNGVTLNVNSGDIGLDVTINNSTINIAGGEVALDATNLAEGLNSFNNTITVTGGAVGSFFQLRGTSTLEIAGGSVEGFGTLPGATATITGGSFNLTDVNGVTNISGGDFNTFRALPGSTVNLFGTEFFLGGVPIDRLDLNDRFVVTERDVVLSGTLSDGSTFSNLLDATTAIADLNFSPNFGEILPGFAASADLATVSVTLVSAVPEPGTMVLVGGLAMAMLVRRRR